MRIFNTLLAPLVVLTAVTRAEDSPTAALERLKEAMPECGLQCLMDHIPKSICALTDTSCICTNAPLNHEIGVCVSGGCTIPDALLTKNVSLTMCGVEMRDNRQIAYVCAIAGSAVTSLFVLLRLLVIFSPGGKQPGWEDALLVMCLALALVPGGLSGYLKEAGLGRDIWTLKPEQITNVLFYFVIGEIAYLEAMGILKIAILWFLLSIFPDKQFRRYVYVTMGLCAVYCVAFFFATIFQCTPITYSWTQWDGLHLGKCNNIHMQGWLSAIANIVLDITVMVLPLRQLSRLNMNWKKKVAVMSMFLVGTVVLVISAVRLQSLVYFSNSQNITWDYVASSYWSVIELDVGIICACMPSIRILLLRYFPKMFSNATTKNSVTQRSDKNLSPSHVDTGYSSSDFILLVDQESLQGGKKASANVKALGPLEV